jgi:hypothetical protein
VSTITAAKNAVAAMPLPYPCVHHRWRNTNSPDSRLPGVWYQRCEVCGLDERTDDGLGNMQQTLPEMQ